MQLSKRSISIQILVMLLPYGHITLRNCSTLSYVWTTIVKFGQHLNPPRCYWHNYYVLATLKKLNISSYGWTAGIKLGQKVQFLKKNSFGTSSKMLMTTFMLPAMDELWSSSLDSRENSWRGVHRTLLYICW